MTENCELRARARKVLGGRIFSNEWLLALVVSLIVSAVVGITSYVMVGILLTGIMTFGHDKYYLGRSRGTVKSDQFEVLIDGFKNNVGSNLLLGLLIAIFTALWSLLFVIPGIVKAYSYSMAYYVKVDHPEYTATQAIDESRRIMNGNKMKLFLLDLSFIGWIIVGAICFGVGTLWVIAYMNAAYTEFYRDIIGDVAAAGTNGELGEEIKEEGTAAN